MRRVAAGVLAGLLLFALGRTGVPAPAAAVVPSDPKVVLVVGATHGTTSHVPLVHERRGRDGRRGTRGTW